MDLESLSGHEAEDRTRFIRLQRKLYRPYLDGLDLERHASVDASVDDGAEEQAGLSSEAARPLVQALEETLSLLNLLRRQGELLARDPMPAMKTKFLATWQRVRATLEAQERLALLAALWTFEAERSGQDLADILALAARFSVLLEQILPGIDIGTGVA